MSETTTEKRFDFLKNTFLKQKNSLISRAEQVQEKRLEEASASEEGRKADSESFGTTLNSADRLAQGERKAGVNQTGTTYGAFSTRKASETTGAADFGTRTATGAARIAGTSGGSAQTAGTNGFAGSRAQSASGSAGASAGAQSATGSAGASADSKTAAASEKSASSENTGENAGEAKADKPKPEEIGEEVIKNYLSETRWLISTLRESPSLFREILRVLSITRDNSRILGFNTIYKIYRATETLYKSLCDEKTVLSQNIEVLLRAVSVKLEECCTLIEKKEFEELEEMDVFPYLLYLDKAGAGEIFDAVNLIHRRNEAHIHKHSFDAVHKKEKEEDSLLSIKSSQIAHLVNQHEEMIARTYILMNQVDLLKTSLYDGDMKAARNTYKQLANDTQNLQNNLLISHDQLMSFMQDDSFLARHQDFQGFFVLANGRKYLIPAEFVVDVISESPYNYEEKQNQKFVIYIQENESGSEKNREEIPVYSLSSLLPGTPVQDRAVMDTIIIVLYQGQKLGIIVDALLKFVSLIKKPMPASFANFPVLKGVAFDEKYDMIPILYTPEIMKKFLAMRGYDVKKFEAATRKHVPRILIVDDSETTRLIEHSIVESNGCMVEEASDGIDALEKIKTHQFDLVICDDDMPRMNGEIFTENLKRLDNYKNVPVIALSVKPIPKADVFIGKSVFTRDNLIQKIKELLSHE